MSDDQTLFDLPSPEPPPTASRSEAWQRAAPPFAPLHRIPGITWSPVEAVVAHVPAR